MIYLSFWLLSILDQTGRWIQASVLDFFRFGNTERNNVPEQGQQWYNTEQSGQGAPLLLQSASAQNGSGTSQAVTLPFNARAGSKIIVIYSFITLNNATLTGYGASDGTNVYTVEKANQSGIAGTPGTICFIATTTNSVTGPLTITASVTIGAFLGESVLAVYEWNSSLSLALPTLTSITSFPYTFTASRLTSLIVGNVVSGAGTISYSGTVVIASADGFIFIGIGSGTLSQSGSDTYGGGVTGSFG